jgi:hypothetical protein
MQPSDWEDYIVNTRQPIQIVSPPQFESLEARLLMSAASPVAATETPQATDPALGDIHVAYEEESNGGATNDDMASAQELEFAAMLPDQPGADGTWAQQAVVVGTADGAGGGDGYELLVTRYTKMSYPGSSQLNFSDAVAPGGGGVLTITTGANFTGESKYLTLQAEGIDLGRLFVDDGQVGSEFTTQVALSQSDLAALAADGVISFTVTPSEPVAEASTTYVQMHLEYAGAGGGTADFYRLDLDAGESISLALSEMSAGELDLQLIDADGDVLATGAAGSGDMAAAISNYLADQGGTVFVRVAGTGEYSLTVNRNAGMDLEDNDTFASAQPLSSSVIDGHRWASGQIGDPASGSDSDFYTVTMTSRSLLKVRAYTPGDSNTLEPMVRIYDSSGSLVASSTDLQTVYRVPEGGDGLYYIQVSAINETDGDYVLSVQSHTPKPKGKPQGHGRGLLSSASHRKMS